MITNDSLGINLGFANNRFPEPDVWTDIVANKLGLHKVQFVADILNPMIKRYNEIYYKDQVSRTVECITKYNISVTSIMTSSFTRVNHFAHPHGGYRETWFMWFIDFLKTGSLLGAKSAGSHFGILTADSLRNKEVYYKEALQYWKELSIIAKDLNYDFLFFEPMSVDREFGNTIESTKIILDDLNSLSALPFKLCLDVGHAPHPSQRDYRDWLKVLAKDSSIIHLQQTTLNSSNHSPFTDKYNRSGIIDPVYIINYLNSNGLSPELDLEISFREKEEIENTVVPDLIESVSYLKRCIGSANESNSN
jgi:sugar phosphate isomerase/epimerase